MKVRLLREVKVGENESLPKGTVLEVVATEQPRGETVQGIVHGDSRNRIHVIPGYACEIVDLEGTVVVPITGEYVDRDGTLKPCESKLTYQRQAELLAHLYHCNTALQDCPECWELYSNLGHGRYVEILTSFM